jgi:hypothetical protein
MPTVTTPVDAPASALPARLARTAVGAGDWTKAPLSRSSTGRGAVSRT